MKWFRFGLAQKKTKSCKFSGYEVFSSSQSVVWLLRVSVEKLQAKFCVMRHLSCFCSENLSRTLFTFV